MVAGRWVLLVSMALLGPLSWWAGVADTSAAAYAALAVGDTDGHYFISNYDGPGRAVAGFFAFLNLILLAVLMPTARGLRTRRIGTFVRAVATSVLAVALAWFEYVFNPVSTNWGGDPDAWSMVKRHLAPWYGGVAVAWITLVTVTATAIAGLAVAAAVSAARERRRQPAGR
jgi:hypothetical protein